MQSDAQTLLPIALLSAASGARTDKLPGVPDRIDPPLLLGRWRQAYRLRRSLSDRLPAVAAALIEDALVAGVAVTGAALIASRT